MANIHDMLNKYNERTTNAASKLAKLAAKEAATKERADIARAAHKAASEQLVVARTKLADGLAEWSGFDKDSCAADIRRAQRAATDLAARVVAAPADAPAAQ